MDRLNKNPWANIEDSIDAEIPTATLGIYKYIEDYLGDREIGTANRCSSAPMCVKRRWYHNQGFTGTPLTPRKIINFFQGNLGEATMIHFIKNGLVGPGKLYSEVQFGDVIGTFNFQGKPIDLYSQKTMSFKIGKLEITGHYDGIGKRNSDGQWELIECKTAADYGFADFKRKVPDYIKQAHALMICDELKAKNVQSVRFYYLRKSTGHLFDRLFSFDPQLADQVIRDFQTAAGEKEPDAPFDFVPEMKYKKPTGRYTVPWQCGYCNYMSICKPNAQVEFKQDQFGNLRPTYIFQKR